MPQKNETVITVRIKFKDDATGEYQEKGMKVSLLGGFDAAYELAEELKVKVFKHNETVRSQLFGNNK